jgi:hypothetical protein
VQNQPSRKGKAVEEVVLMFTLAAKVLAIAVGMVFALMALSSLLLIVAII